MKTFKRILIGLLGLVIVLVIIAFLLPASYHVERSISINSSKQVIYDLTSHFQKWDLWTPWTKALDSTAKFELVGADGEVGTKRTWEGKVLGDGQMVLTQLKPGELVAYDLSFQKGKYQSKGKITIEETGDSCKVSWIDEGDLGYNPMARYMGLFMGRMMNPDFDKGLSKLKQIAEQRKTWPKMEETKIPEQYVLVIKDSAGINDYSKVMGKAYLELYTWIKKGKYTPTGAPFMICLKWDSVTKFSVVKIGVPINKEGTGAGRIMAEKIPAQNAVMAYYFGPYEKSEPAYIALEQYCRELNKEIVGGPMEIYINDPSTEKDPLKLETHILFPVK
jgi:effector-binding domain-containing protein